MIGTEYIKERLDQALAEIGAETAVMLEQPKDPSHGDLATNIAMSLASTLRKNPREIAREIVDKLDLDNQKVSGVEIAGAGFINFRLNERVYREALQKILEQGSDFGKSQHGAAKKVLFEFVSANPTGPLNVVSARAATVGDVLGNIYSAVGFDCEKEYYVNDAGRQVRLLGMSVSSRYMELIGKTEPFPEEGYHGDYVRDLAQEILDDGEKCGEMPDEERWETLQEIALSKLLNSQKEILKNYGVYFDRWFHESRLRDENLHLSVLKKLRELGHVYEKDEAVWFRASEFGDEKDRVLMTQDGAPTYFLVDIAYHDNKYSRGFEQLYDLWGPDHHGYIDRMKGALLALGYEKDTFEVMIVQQVNLLESGEVVKMSKRAGRIIEMKELLDEVGVDVARYFFLMRRNQSPLDFDIDLAKNTSEENPVFYVQYAHARICNILTHAEEQGVVLQKNADLDFLQTEEEMALIKKLLEYPDILIKAAQFLEPHRIPNYLQEVAASFHRFYHQHRVVSDDKDLTAARLLLVKCAQIVFANALRLMGISAPERM